MVKWIVGCCIALVVLFAGFMFLQKSASRCQPNQSCWPSEKEWLQLKSQLTGQLVKPVSVIEPCLNDPASDACAQALENVKNPFFLLSNPAGGENQGWYKAWDLQVSDYAVEAENAADVAAAVNFARLHNLRLVVKGTGHDYLGRASAAGSLLIWTHKMRETQFHDSFTCSGAPNEEKEGAAITVGAGTLWLDVYKEATVERGQYVQGGGCLTVGAAGGFTQGSGFGSFSKKFGTAAASVLEVEVVTADGQILIANRYQNQDLFWALCGGGGGTFGVVTKMTFKTHPLPKYFVWVNGKITAKNDEDYKVLIQKFITFFYKNLNNENWGEQFLFHSDNTIKIAMGSQDLSLEQVETVWQPFKKWVQQYPQRYSIEISNASHPPRQQWDYRYYEKNSPNDIVLNKMEGASEGEYTWSGDTGAAFAYLYAYQSWWLPAQLFEDANISKLAEIFFRASRLFPVQVHTNKGLLGASPEAIARTRETSMNPAVYDAACLIIMADGSTSVYPGIEGHEPSENEAERSAQKISQAMRYFREAAPNAGSYANEADFFQDDWQSVFWGAHYDRLLRIKQKYDPTGLFTCHHCIGSEYWSEDGMTRKKLGCYFVQLK